MKETVRALLRRALAILACAGGPAGAPERVAPLSKDVSAEEAWKIIAPYFRPPKEYENDFGPHKPVLRFYDGGPLKTAEDWKRRRAEIRTKWDEMRGSWPPLIEKPKIEYVSNVQKPGYVQHTVKVGLAPQWDPWTCYLLLPEVRGPFPAAVTVYYYPEGPLRHK